MIVEHGASLAKGPALIVGSILVAFGLASLLKNNDFPSFSSSFPDGEVQGTNFLGIEVNGWTAFFSITAGALLLFGAAQHHLAKMMSLLVGLALVACAVIAVIDGQDVLGLAAANTWTKLGFAVAGALMLLNALMPRRTRTREIAAPGAGAPTYREDEAIAPRRTSTRFGRPEARPATVDDEPRTTVADEPRTTVAEREPVGATTATDDTTATREASAAPATTRRRRRRFFSS